jgi:hypothetical protein
MLLITKKEAITSGLKKYYTGKPCKRGHISERHTSNSMCCQCKKETYNASPKLKAEMAAYCKKWRLENADYHKNYNSERRELIAERTKNNRANINKRSREIYAERKGSEVRAWNKNTHNTKKKEEPK